MRTSRLLRDKRDLFLTCVIDCFETNTFTGYSIYRCSMMTVVQISLMSIFWDLIFDLLKCVL